MMIFPCMFAILIYFNLSDNLIPKYSLALPLPLKINYETKPYSVSANGIL